MRNTFLGVQERPIRGLDRRSDTNALRVPDMQRQGEAVLLRLSESENEWSMSFLENESFGEGVSTTFEGAPLFLPCFLVDDQIVTWVDGKIASGYSQIAGRPDFGWLSMDP